MNEPQYVAIYWEEVRFEEKVKSNNEIAGFL